MELLIQIILAGGGAFLLYLCFLAYRRNWKFHTTLFASLGIGALAFSTSAIQGFLKSGVLAAFISYGEKLDLFQSTVGTQEIAIRSHQLLLDQHQKVISEQQGELIKLHTQLAIAHDEILKRSSEASQAITKAQDRIVGAQGEIDSQRKDISDVKYLVRGLLSATETEVFNEEDEKRYVVTPVTGDTAQAVAIFVLKDVPFKDSVRVQFHVWPQPPNSYSVSGNLIIFRWGESIESIKGEALKKRHFYVEYIADPNKAGEANEIISVKGAGGIEFKNPIEAFLTPRNVISPKSIVPTKSETPKQL